MDGSWFIQSLCHELEQNVLNVDLGTLLVNVTRRVAIDYENKNPDNPDELGKNQIPCTVTMLTRLVQFTEKR